MKKEIIYTLLLVLLSVTSTLSQEQKFVNRGFYNNDHQDVCKGASMYEEKDVRLFVNTICEKVNQVNRFAIVPCSSIPNCQAVMHNGKPYILYNASFINKVKELDFSNSTMPKKTVNWTVMTVLAHEIGHHVRWHFISPEPNMDQMTMELEADKFAGFAMYMLGATLPQAQEAMRDVPLRDGYTHPGRSKRLAAIKAGYDDAKRKYPRTTNSRLPEVTSEDVQVKKVLEEAEEYYSKSKYKQAYPIFYKYRYHRLFSSNNMHRLGYMYNEGLGVELNETEAVKWYRRAAMRGNAASQLNLGYMYEFAEGVDKDNTEAVKWYRKSADQGNATAQANLGHMYEYGKGVAKNYSEALRWYHKSAKQGSARGQNKIGRMYQYGKGVKQNYSEAIKWYRKSAEKGNAVGQVNLGYMYGTGTGVSKNYSEAVKWYRKSALQGDETGQSNLGYMYYNGYGVSKSYKEAYYWYYKSATQNYAKAQYWLGYLYENGLGTDKSFMKAKEWYQKSANQDFSSAKTALRRLGTNNTVSDEQVKSELKKADEYIKEKNYASAYTILKKYQDHKLLSLYQKNWLGRMYETGRGTTKNYKLANYWYNKTAALGSAYGQYSLGYTYQHGRGVEKDINEALKWYRKAADQDYQPAIKALEGFSSTVTSEQVKLELEKAERYYNNDNYKPAFAILYKYRDHSLLNNKHMNWLGYMYDVGSGVSEDDKEAVKWYLKSATLGNAFAQSNLGNMYLNGEGVAKNYSEAIKWYRKSVEQGNDGAQTSLGYMYTNGIGVTQDYHKAIILFRESATQGNRVAQGNLGSMYYNGYGVDKSYKQAFSWFMKSALQNLAKSQYWVGYMYENGLSVDKSLAKAKEWYQKAADQNYQSAKTALERLNNNKCKSIVHTGEVEFAGSSARLSSTSKEKLALLASQMFNESCKVVVRGSGNLSKIQQQRSWDRVNAIIEHLVNVHGVKRERFIFQYAQAGNPNIVSFRAAHTGESGPSRAAPPFPNLRRN